MDRTRILKIKFILLIIIVLVFNCPKVFATNLNNTENQYMELKVASIQDIDGADKQVTLEWWSYNLKFKGLDLRFSYDETKLKPSNINTNAYTDTATELLSPTTFNFAGDFGANMEYTCLAAEDGIYRCVMSFKNNNGTGTYIEDDSNLGHIVNTNVDGRSIIRNNEFQII